jgi:multidrug efflux pump subunit AcrB
MVRGYYLRKGLNLGELQLSLSPKHDRERSSHEVAFLVRDKLKPYIDEAVLKVVEVPPGPPVMSAILAEVYVHDKVQRDTLTAEVQKSFQETEGICDIDTKLERSRVKKIIVVDAKRAERYGVTISDINEQLEALSSETIAYVHNKHNVDSIPIVLSLEDYEKSLKILLQTKVKGVFLSELVTIKDTKIDSKIYHKDLRALNYVSANVSELDESPLYGMFDIIASMDYVKQHLWSTPFNIDGDVKWDGEWKITYETFRDMGIAYLVGLFFLYLLLVHQYNSYIMPLVMMSPIPLTIIGVLPGHYLYHASFTATSMIGMIALAGIIVRNSVLLIDFIQEELDSGKDVESAILESVKVRTKPILITALTAILGSMFILSDPVFEGMAISLISGVLVATFLTLLVIPVLFSLTSLHLKEAKS